MRHDTTPSPKHNKDWQLMTVSFKDSKEIENAKFFYDHGTNTCVMIHEGGRRDSDSIADEDGMVVGLWLSEATLFSEEWIKWQSEVTLMTHVESEPVHPDSKKTKKGTALKKPASCITPMKRPAGAIGAGLPTDKQKMIDAWAREQIAYENSAKGQALDRRRNYVNSRMHHKLHAKMAKAGIDKEGVLGPLLAKCMWNIKNVL